MPLVTVAEIARVFNRTERHIQMLVREGMPREKHGQYELGRCMQWYILFLQRKIATRAGEDPEATQAATLDKERTRLTRAQADVAELDLALKRGDLVPLQIFEATMVKMVTAARQQLLQLPARVSHELEGENRDNIKRRLTLAIHAALKGLQAGGTDQRIDDAVRSVGDGAPRTLPEDSN